MLIRVTKKQRENALYLRDVLWPSVPESSVLEDLYPFEYGQQACLGGWVARSPYFQAQGVIRGPLGIPCIPSTHDGPVHGTDVSAILFGDEFMFAGRNEELGDSADVSGHEVARQRIERLIANSVVEEEAVA